MLKRPSHSDPLTCRLAQIEAPRPDLATKGRCPRRPRRRNRCRMIPPILIIKMETLFHLRTMEVRCSRGRIIRTPRSVFAKSRCLQNTN